MEISFKDDTGMISNSMMQILGLHDPFMRQYEGAAFTETVEFSAEPEYWVESSSHHSICVLRSFPYHL